MHEQDIADPQLQHLAFEAKLAIASLKYIAVPPHLLSTVISAVEDASKFEMWATRGAALAFLQVEDRAVGMGVGNMDTVCLKNVA